MMEGDSDMLDERWVFHENAEPVQAGPGVSGGFWLTVRI